MHVGTLHMLDKASDFPGVISALRARVLAFNPFPPTFQMSHLGISMACPYHTKLIPGLRSPASTILTPRRQEFEDHTMLPLIK